MNSDLDQMADSKSLAPFTSTQIFIQKSGVILAKAALSSIPFPSLVFDVGQLAVDLANKKVTEKFLHDLAEQIDRLDDEIKKSLKFDPIHEAAAYAALRALAFETSETVATVLARAVSNLAEMLKTSTYKAQCARIISEFNEPMLHALQTNDRFHRDLLTDEERSICSGFEADIESMAALLNATLSVPDWDPIMRRIMALGLIEQHFDAGNAREDRIPMVQTAPTSVYGRVVIDLCFDDVSAPLFGRFANTSKKLDNLPS